MLIFSEAVTCSLCVLSVEVTFPFFFFLLFLPLLHGEVEKGKDDKVVISG